MNLKVDPRLICGVLLFGLTALLASAWSTRDTATAHANKSELRLVALQELAARHRVLQPVGLNEAAPVRPLFDIFNTHAEAAGLKSSVERLQPRPATDPKQPERLEARLSESDPAAVVLLLTELEQEVDVESLVLTRTSKLRLNVDMVLARKQER